MQNTENQTFVDIVYRPYAPKHKQFEETTFELTATHLITATVKANKDWQYEYDLSDPIQTYQALGRFRRTPAVYEFFTQIVFSADFDPFWFKKCLRLIKMHRALANRWN